MVIAHACPPSTTGSCIPIPDNTKRNVYTLLRQSHVYACTCTPTYTRTHTHTKMRDKPLLNRIFFWPASSYQWSSKRHSAWCVSSSHILTSAWIYFLSELLREVVKIKGRSKGGEIRNKGTEYPPLSKTWWNGPQAWKIGEATSFDRRVNRQPQPVASFGK